MKSTALLRILRFLLILSIPFLLIIGSISFLTNDGYLMFEYGKPSFPNDPFGFSAQERLTHAADNLRYIRQNLPSAFLEQQNHNGQPLYNPREVSHMADVQSVFQGTWNAGKVLAVIVLFTSVAITWREQNRKWFFSGVQYGGFITASIIAIVGMLAVIGWNTWFTAFHQIFFNPGTWTFMETDTLIRLFPLPFWFDGALTVSGLTLFGGILLGFVGRFFKNRWMPQTV